MTNVKKRIISFAFVMALLATNVFAVIPARAAVYDNPEFFRKPIEAVYESSGEMGYAKGTLTVKVDNWINTNDGGCKIDAVAFWGNANGRLPGYSHLARFKLSTRTTTFEFPELQIIPKDADRLIVYTSIHGTDILSEQSVMAMLPEGYGYNLEDTPITSFVVVSDTHLRGDDNAHANKVFKDMLNDVKNDFPGVSGIFINGDNINASGMGGNDVQTSATQFAKIEQYRQSIIPNVPIFMGVGNHDLWPNAMQDSAKDMFLGTATLPDGSNPESLHYDFYLNGYHFVFVGDDDRDPNYATLSENTLKWLDETVGKSYDEETPTFIFLHQGISNTVAGTLTNFDQEWDGVTNVVEVRRVLRKYPRAVLFTGHSHYSMDSVQNAYPGGTMFPTTFNTASLSNVISDTDEAQGYVIEVYEKAVIVRGRDFAANEWKASAQYAVDYGAELTPAPDIPTNKDDENTNVNDGNNGGSNSGSNNNQENVTDRPTDQGTEGSDAATDGRGEEKSGCQSAMGSGALAVAILPAALCLIRKRKED